jgi:hypothetical protein
VDKIVCSDELSFCIAHAGWGKITKVMGGIAGASPAECERARLHSLRKNSEIGGWGFERARLQPRLTALFKDLRHGWEAVPLQNSNAREFFRKLFSRAAKPAN